MDYINNINLLEEEDRYIASSVITDILSGKDFKDIKCTGTPISCSVDLWCECNKDKNYSFNVEIKRNNKSDYLLLIYPHALLKKDKLIRMIKASPNKPLYYMILLNEDVAYIYNCRKIKWSLVELVNLRLKRTLFNPNSDWITVPTFRIPYELARKVNIKLYYADYKQTKQQKEMDSKA